MLTTLVTSAVAVVVALIAAWVTLRARRPPKSRVELVDVSIPAPDPATADLADPPVLDVKVRNTGGQPAVLKRMVVHVHRAVRFGDTSLPEPYDVAPGLVGAALPASATHDVQLPDPDQAAGARITADLSQVVGPREADRFLVRLARPYLYDLVAYSLHLEVRYDGDDRTVTSRPLAVVFPQRVVIASAEDLGREIRGFRRAVGEVRHAIDRELAARGLPVPDWRTAPPRSRGELPAGLVSVDGNGNAFDSGANGVYVVNEDFWDPERTIGRYLDDVERRYRQLVEICAGADVVHGLLRDALDSIHATLAQLPALRATAPEEDTAQAPPGGNPDADDDELVALLGGRRVLDELRARADAGDEKIARQLPTAVRLAEKVRRLGRTSPEVLDDRDKLIQWWMTFSGDVSGAAAAWAELIQDQLPVYGNDHSRTLQARHFLAKCRGEAGDPAGAVEAFDSLLADRRRVLGPDHTATLDSRHELARWRAMAGDPAGAVEAFDELVTDRVRVQGRDHPRTFATRYNLAYSRGKAGNAVGAAEAFAELVQDQVRVLGPDDPDAIRSRTALAYWRDQAGQEDAPGRQ